MPFTPIHLGPGAAFKAIGGRHFSFMVFGGSQVLMNIEPLIGILRGWAILHGYTHTVAGAAAIGVVAALIGKPISTYVLGVLRIPHPPFTWTAAVTGAFLGTFSHIALDAVMHSDIRPWWPFDGGNGLLRVISIDELHVVCWVLGVLGALVISGRALVRRRLYPSDEAIGSAEQRGR